MPRPHTIERTSIPKMKPAGSLREIKSLEDCCEDRFDKNRLLVMKEFLQHLNQMTKGDED
jgi:hypothetical protein